MEKKRTLDVWLGLFLSLSFIPFTIAYAQGPQHAASGNCQVPAGYHEFEMFGERSIYLSHYPMFGSIHAYQLIMEVSLKSTDGRDAKELYLSHKQKNPRAKYSVSPETSGGEPDYWVLPDMIKKGHSFRANIHLPISEKSKRIDHIARNITVEIKKVVHFRLFKPDDKAPEELTYLLFGNDSETFMAHYIGNHPDCDQILSVRIDPKNFRFNEDDPAVVVTIPGRRNKNEFRLLEKGKTAVGRIKGGEDKLQIDVGRQIHYEPDLEIQR